MTVLKIILGLALFKCVLSEEVSLVQACAYKDMECLSQATEKFLERTSAGMPKYNIKAIDPLFIPALQYADTGSDIVFHFKNITVTGLKNLKISDFQLDKTAKTVILKTKVDANIVSDLTVELTQASKFLSGTYYAKASGITTAYYNYVFVPRKGVEYFELGPETITCEPLGVPEVTLDSEFAKVIANDPEAIARREAYVKRSSVIRKETICEVLKKAYETVISNVRASAKILPKTSFFKDI